MTAAVGDRRADEARERRPRVERIRPDVARPGCDAVAGHHASPEARCADVLPELIVELI
jgi:hypothetical protein